MLSIIQTLQALYGALIDDMMQSYDQSDGNDYSIAEGVHMISPTDTPLQLLFPKGQATAKKHEWIEDELQAQTSALAATLSTTDGTALTVTAGDGLDKFPSDVATYNVVIRIDQEYMLVTAVPSTDVLTVTRAHAGTAATHANLAVIHIVSEIETEGADGKVSRARGRSRPSNYIQTFSKTIKVTGVQEKVKKLGRITSEISYEIGQGYKDVANQLEKTIIMGAVSAAGDATTPSTMAGLWAKIASANKTSDSGSVDTAAIEEDIKTIFNAGGTPRAIVGDGKMVQDIGSLYTDRIREGIQTRIGGYNINAIINPLGDGPIALIPHRMCAAGEYYMLDNAKIKLMYLRAFNMEPLAKDGDYERRWLGGDYTLEFKNASAHAYRYGFS